jgi:hypothetical protein
MLQRGDIVIERLTGNRAIVIRTSNTEEITCRFTDGRLDDRFTFEMDLAVTFFGALLSLLSIPFESRPREHVLSSVAAGSRILARQLAS